jgi:hypothetical protein
MSPETSFVLNIPHTVDDVQHNTGLRKMCILTVVAYVTFGKWLFVRQRSLERSLKMYRNIKVIVMMLLRVTCYSIHWSLL